MKKAKDIFNRFLEENGLNNTRQRELILEAFIRTGKHLSADEFYNYIVVEHPDIGRTTVYRMLKLMCDAGLAIEINLDDRITRYEFALKDPDHDHMICSVCNKLYEVSVPELEHIKERLSSELGFKTLKHILKIFGICPVCQRKGMKSNG